MAAPGGERNRRQVRFFHTPVQPHRRRLALGRDERLTPKPRLSKLRSPAKRDRRTRHKNGSRICWESATSSIADTKSAGPNGTLALRP